MLWDLFFWLHTKVHISPGWVIGQETWGLKSGSAVQAYGLADVSGGLEG